jgi:tripartite-type tricarboxylate transporter receptor subunit TctC
MATEVVKQAAERVHQRGDRESSLIRIKEVSAMATSGNGLPQHITGAFFMLKTGTKMVFVPYHGGAPAITDLMGGQIQVYFSPLPESMAVIKAGKVR